MDSSGLGLIMGRYNTIKEIGGTVKVADPSPSIEKIMKLAGLERIIKIVRLTKKNQETAVPKAPAAVAAMNTTAYSESKTKNVKEVDEK